ncbi:MAG: redoxin domain-containing protein [Verrucomicrobiales bacterium]|nr:redoxin domain-containing protein [Verrucomicrobiales bacterium]
MKGLFPVIALLVIISPASARERFREALFHKFDRDGDGVVTATELPDERTRAKFDQDGNGDVTLAEYRKAIGITSPEKTEDPDKKQTEATARFDAYIREKDKNYDGKLSREEVGTEAWFEKVDRNKDGEIGVGEIAAVRLLVNRLGDKWMGSIPENQVTKEEFVKITSGPEILKPGDVGIGRMIADTEYLDLNGNRHRISDAKNHKGLVIAMTSATCPVSKRLLPSLAKLEPTLLANDIPLILVNAFASESKEEILEQLEGLELKAPYIHDIDKSLSKTLHASTTTEVFLIDAKQTLIYRGALDDQYGIDYSVNEPRHRYLEEAVTAFLAGKEASIAATAAPGCELNLGEGSELKTDITYHRDIARILQRNCVKCHHDGGIAPFALDDITEVSDRAKVIARVVSEGTMPPWFAAPPKEGEPSVWANDHSLSPRDKADLLAWLDSDQPEGNPADAPAPLSFPDEWTTGTPDMVIPLSRAYKIKATGFMPYQKDIVTTTLTEDKWVTGYEILPSERDVVHHVIVQVFEKGNRVKDRSEAAGYWAAYVPGNGAVLYPEGFARKLPAGAKVHFQIHYTPSGKEKMERLKMGLHFADEPPKYEIKTLAVADHRLNIPPGAPAHQEGTTRTVPFDIPAMSFMAHMHTRGSAFSYEITYPDGKSEMLLDIPRYDFNWQLRYELKTPKFLPKGSTVKVTGVFDNSTNNKANPDPTKTVKWGDQTVDEMLIGYIEYFVPIADQSVASSQ